MGHARVKTEASLVGANSIVVLHAPAALHADVPVVVLPADTEAHHAVWLGDAPQDLSVVVDFLVGDVVEDIARHLVDGLLELCLSGITPLQALHELLEIDVIRYGHRVPLKEARAGLPPGREEQPFWTCTSEQIARRSVSCESSFHSGVDLNQRPRSIPVGVTTCKGTC